MTDFDGRIFTGRARITEFSEINARNCSFHACDLPKASRVGSWNRINDVTLEDVDQLNCSLDTTAIENVTLRNLKRSGSAPLFLWACVFRHVKLAGKISGIKVNRWVGIGSMPSVAEQPDWDSATLTYYEDVDWALDISEAKFGGGVTFEAVPGHLVRRDPETQVLVTRQRLLSEDWQSIDFDQTAIDYAISWFLQDSLFESVVIPARADPKWKKRDVAVLNKLRAQGLAEPD